jgi:phosphopantothenoylcysteine decarboxylase/phosphopantothenate--cysteine ligase
MSNLNNKRIVLIVSGGIAAYKALELVRRLRDDGAAVRVVMTAAAMRFVGKLSFQALSGEPVHSDLLDARAEAAMGHIELARWADAIVVAPATANFMARLRYGLADDLGTTLCLASTAPLLLAPAMNQQMWHNQATQDNALALTARGIKSIGPDSGTQACGETGPGRMAEPPAIAAAVTALFSTGTMTGIRVMVTAGPTREAIDPVRYLSNRSSGKMGYAIAQAAHEAGAEVTLVSGPVALSPPTGVRTTNVESADQMYDAVIESIDNIDIFIACAAVADYRIERPAEQKRKKDDRGFSLTLTPTRDILHSVTTRRCRPFAVGFAAETENLVANARAKLEKKSLNMVAANEVGVAGLGFESNENELQVLWKGGERRLAKAAKGLIARQLIGLIAKCYRSGT